MGKESFYLPLIPEHFIPNSESTTIVGIRKTTNSANDSGFGAIFIAPKTGTINSVYINIMGVSATPPSVVVALDTVNSIKTPALDFVGSTNEFVAVSGATWVTLTTPASVTAGRAYAVWLNDLGATTSVPFDSTHQITAGNAIGYHSSQIGAWSTPTPFSCIGGAFAYLSAIPMVVPRYDDGTIPLGFAPIKSLSLSTSWSSSSTPNRRGNTFKVPFNCRCNGVMAGIQQGSASSDMWVVLSDNGNVPLSSGFISGGMSWTPQHGGVLVEFPDTALVAEKDYKIYLQPTTTNTITDSFMQFTLESDVQLLTRGIDIKRITSADGVTWSTVATGLMLITPLISSIYSGGRRGHP